MKPVTVLQILTCDDVGGTENMVATLLEGINRRRVRPTVVTLDAPGPVAERLEHAGIPVRSLGEGGLARAFVRLAEILHRERFDVVNAYGFKATIVTRLLVRVLAPQAAFVCGVRGLHVSELEAISGPKSRAILAVERLASHLVDVYDANSQGALDLLARTGIAQERLHYIPNGIDLSYWDGDHSGERRSLRPAILCVARFVGRKRHADLLHAARILVDRGVAFRLVLVGDGPTRPRMKLLTEEYGIEAVTDFQGTLDREGVRQAMQHATLFCLASAWEGMAGTVMEAMASGLPVVGTRVNGIAEVVEHGCTGYLVPPRRPDLLADALGQLVDDPERAAAFGRAGRDHVGEHFALDRMISAKEDLYVSLAGKR
jgi:glycosyltransferase involved in cell wall biosynthesis